MGKPEKLSENNYYNNEQNYYRLSVSQFKRFEECEAAALAELKGLWERPWNLTPLLVGNYVHSYFESEQAHEKFKEKHKDQLFSSRKPYGLLKAFQIAQQMVERVEREPLFNFLYQGEHEVIVTEELFGVNWKAKVDLLNVEKGYFIDLKTTASLTNRTYSEKYNRYVSFVEAWGTVLQVAIYEQLLEKKYGKPFRGFIYAVTKETPSNVAAISIEERKKRFELDRARNYVKRIERVKNGEVEPKACGTCEYCREFKQLEGFITTDELLS